MKKIIVLIIVLLQSVLYAQIPTNYYDSAAGLAGYTLKTELSNIITNGHVDQGYGAFYTNPNGYIVTDNDAYYENDGSVLDMYSENPTGTDSYNYAHDSNGGSSPGDACGNYSSEGDCYNREHLFPQGFFSQQYPMRSDIHYVVASDGKVNGFRNNYPFGVVGTLASAPTGITNPTQNGSKLGTSVSPGYSGTVFEPIDEFKGDIARCLLYFAVRYEDNWNDSGWSSHTATNNTLNGTSNQFYDTWYVNLLLSWHAQDPVSQREIDRNNACYLYQGNANPFINHPEYANAIWNPTPDTQNPTTPTNLVANNETFNTVDLAWTASTDDIGIIGYDIYRDGSLVGTSLATPTTYTDSGLTSSTTYSYYVVAKDAAQNVSTNSNTIQATTLSGPIFSENFNDCALVLANFTIYNEASNEDWECATQFGEGNTGSMQMNGFQEDVASKDWLITTNAIDFSQYINETLSVYLIHKYGSMSMDLLYSTDYDGTSNPATATWTAMPNITIDTHNGTSTEAIQVITNADISALTQPAYVAFKYYSNGSPTRWTVDNFVIDGDNVAAVTTNLFSENLLVYPNPVNNLLTIESVDLIQSIVIFNQLGQQVLFNINSNTIDVTILHTGIYFTRVTNKDGKTALRKIIKQ